MSQELHEAEETRDQAITYMQQREAELTNQLTQTEAELQAAMDGLGAARGEVEERVQGLNLGADDYLAKPFNMQELALRVKKLIEQRQKLRERFTKNLKLE